jgi:hypothetical protein
MKKSTPVYAVTLSDYTETVLAKVNASAKLIIVECGGPDPDPDTVATTEIGLLQEIILALIE